jgi:hypothetical protein
MQIDSEITLDEKRIIVRRRRSDYMAYYEPSTSPWESGGTPEEAVGKLCMRDRKEENGVTYCYSKTFGLVRNHNVVTAYIYTDEAKKAESVSEYTAVGTLMMKYFWDKDNYFDVGDYAQDKEVFLTQFVIGTEFDGSPARTKAEAEAAVRNGYRKYTVRFKYDYLQSPITRTRIDPVEFAREKLGDKFYDGCTAGAAFGIRRPVVKFYNASGGMVSVTCPFCGEIHRHQRPQYNEFAVRTSDCNMGEYILSND